MLSRLLNDNIELILTPVIVNKMVNVLYVIDNVKLFAI